MSRRLFAAVYELETGNRQAFGENIGGFEGESARVLAAGIALVGLQCLDQHQLAAVIEYRRIDVVIGQMSAAVIRIVAQKDVARAPIIVVEMFQPVAYRQLGYESEVRRTDRRPRQATMGIDYGCRCVRWIG